MRPTAPAEGLWLPSSAQAGSPRRQGGSTRLGRLKGGGQTIFAPLNNLATSYRGSFLALAGGIYLLGYIVWSLHAWQKHLGLLPGLRAQYLLAGFLPLAIFLAVLLLAAGTKYLLDEVMSHWGNVSRYLVALPLVAAALGLLVLVPKSWALNLTVPELLMYIVAAEILLIVGVALTLLNPTSKITRRIYNAIYVVILPASIALVGLVAYIYTLYPKIPQELGGVHPKCARLDLVKNEISPTFRASLAITALPSDTIVTTPPLTIYSASGDFITALNPISDNVFQVKKDVVQAMLSVRQAQCTETS